MGEVICSKIAVAPLSSSILEIVSKMYLVVFTQWQFLGHSVIKEGIKK